MYTVHLDSLRTMNGDTLGLFNTAPTVSLKSGTGPCFVALARATPLSYTLAVTSSDTLMGLVSKSPDSLKYISGSVITVTPTAKLGYHFTGWSGDTTGTGSTNPLLVTMNANKSITANFALDAPSTVDVTIAINSGWNLVSVPSVPSTYNAYALFSGAVPGTIYSFFTASYVGAPVLVNGQGYWALYAGAGSETINGAPITTTSEVLATGPRWVLVGSITNAVAASKLTSVPSTAIVPGTLYGYNGASYVAPTTLVPGKGYWVLINAPCTLTISE
jgi:uncharacterized repeat protein (TIGR02543 family)